MRKLGGLIVFWTGVGMAIMIFLPVNIWTIVLTLICLFGGYNCFCNW